MQPLIRLHSVSLRRSGRNLVSGVDWTVLPGQHWALVGPNGAGKTSLMKLARGDIPPTAGTRTYCLDGQEQHTPIGIRNRMALVSPELHEKYVVQSWRITGREVVLAGFFDAWLLYKEPDDTMVEACERTLAELGITELGEKLVGEMSTGELRKVLLARALAPGPDLLFLDECMDGLDQESRAGMLPVLERAGTMAGLVVAAHRMDEIPACVTHGLLLDGGQVRACGELQTVLERQAEIQPACGAASGVPAFWADLQPRTGYPFLLQLERGAHVMDGKAILSDVDWTVLPGECWSVSGANGAGKSTLIKLVLGLVDPLPETRLRWFGEPGLPDLTAVRRRVGLVSAELQAGYGYDLSALDVVCSGFFGSIGLYEKVSDAMRSQARETMRFFRVEEFADRPLRQLSSGQQRRVLLARAVVAGPDLLFLDEPTAGLDEASRNATLELLQQLAEAGLPMVLVTHHEDEIIPAVNRRLRLERGRVVSSR